MYHITRHEAPIDNIAVLRASGFATPLLQASALDSSLGLAFGLAAGIWSWGLSIGVHIVLSHRGGVAHRNRLRETGVPRQQTVPTSDQASDLVGFIHLGVGPNADCTLNARLSICM
jgi:hypothetical protein